MKKIGILFAILLVAGVCAMADEAVAVQGDDLFTDIDAEVMSMAEMEVVDGHGFFSTIVKGIAGAFAAGAVNGGIKEATGVDPWEAGNKAGEAVVKAVKKGYQTSWDVYYSNEYAEYRGWATVSQGY